MSIVALALAAIGGVAAAQDDFPSKPVHIYVPFPPGGAVDIVGRTLGDELSKRWGQTVIIENRPGAGGTIATQRWPAPADTDADIIATSTFQPASLRQAALRYVRRFHADLADWLVDEPVLVKADSPIKTFADLLATARSLPGKLVRPRRNSSHLRASW
jgi:tripartite-type tricarboxylate transporter receptor subunit TctC